MTRFEELLIDKGYIMHTLNCATMKYELGGQSLSSMSNLDNRYIHKDNALMLDKIAEGVSVTSDEFTYKDRNGEIIFGLNQFNKPPTLVSPRPRIRVKRVVNGDVVIQDESLDDSMNIALRLLPLDDIFNAMYDSSKILEIDLT